MGYGPSYGAIREHGATRGYAASRGGHTRAMMVVMGNYGIQGNQGLQGNRMLQKDTWIQRHGVGNGATRGYGATKGYGTTRGYRANKGTEHTGQPGDTRTNNSTLTCALKRAVTCIRCRRPDKDAMNSTLRNMADCQCNDVSIDRSLLGRFARPLAVCLCHNKTQ